MNTPQQQARGFLSSLFDFSFSSYVTPKLIRVIYVVVVVVAALTALGFLVTAFEINILLGLVTLVILAPLAFLFYVILYRVFLEVVMAVFTIAENTTRIASGLVQGGGTYDRGDSGAGGPGAVGFGGGRGGPGSGVEPGSAGGFTSPAAPTRRVDPWQPVAPTNPGEPTAESPSSPAGEAAGEVPGV